MHYQKEVCAKKDKAKKENSEYEDGVTILNGVVGEGLRQRLHLNTVLKETKESMSGKCSRQRAQNVQKPCGEISLGMFTRKVLEYSKRGGRVDPRSKGA